MTDINLSDASSNNDDNKELVKNFDNLIQDAFKSIVKCTKTATSFPSVHENSLLIASPKYISGVASTSDKVMNLVDTLLKSQGMSKTMSKLYLEGQKDILIEANDKLLESINTRIDVMSGKKVATALPVEAKVVKESWNKNVKASNVWQEVSHKKKSNFFAMNSGGSVNERHQLNFKDKVDNSYDKVFEPKLKEKPNALKPYAILLERYDSIESYSHPYEYELDLFVPKEKVLCVAEPREPLVLEETPLILVSEPNQVLALLDDLKNQEEIAVDLEYHNYRSFQGYTCLMQISTRTKDYIVDTLKLRDDLQCLNEVFTDTKILKVFHGADSDIKWLQKDLGIYVVNMFDTHQACKFLPLPRQSLAYLLKHYCAVESDKTFQLFDWRHRPLPEEAIMYARCDTHYLLYVYECMKRDLVDTAHGKQNLLLSTFTNSTNVCKYKYEKPIFNEEGYVNVFRSHAFLTNQQRYALKELYKWRDRTAREMDESIGYVLPNHMLLQIAQSIPRDIQGIFACCNPVPQPVKEHVLNIHAIILKARLQPLTKVVEKAKSSELMTGFLKREKKVVTPPHDSMDSQNYKGLPPVFSDNLAINSQNASLLNSKGNNKMTPAQIGLFFEDSAKPKSSKLKKIKLKTSRFETPYQRFLKSKEYAKAVADKLEKENSERKNASAVIKIEKEVTVLENVVPKEKVALKQVKTEEKIEMEREKRKKILREREDDVQPLAKKIKVEKDETTIGKEVKSEPKENALSVSNESSNSKSKDKTEKSAPKIVDYSRVNFNNKFMVKGTDKKNESKKRGKGGQRGGKKKKR